ncbi:uncharacterized protein LOC126147326 [Schistocerca cancellata]|uniref:uncharacterized protein LOC126147326 n=1 Tax=Schistocerca cancellata TaxID=274614 RepID=UPI0021185F50|nr:uncharacterized protein LOC126147326 [Schistocerca cancellata]
MKVALVLFAALGALAFAEAYRTSTLMPCPSHCPPSLKFVCAKDKQGNIYKFTSHCHMQMCACKMWLEEVSANKCRNDYPGCPLRVASDEVAGEEVASDQDQSQSDESSDGDSQSAAADSLEQAHLQRNSLRKKVSRQEGYRY